MDFQSVSHFRLYELCTGIVQVDTHYILGYTLCLPVHAYVFTCVDNLVGNG